MPCQPGCLTLVAQRHDGDRICISVTDTGIGMSEETRARLFSPFFTTKSDGTGLGLISCKRIAESYGGLIQVCSELGVGTRFDLILWHVHRLQGCQRKMCLQCLAMASVS